MLEFTLRRMRRPVSPSLTWVALGFLMGAGGAAVAELAADAVTHGSGCTRWGGTSSSRASSTGVAVAAARVMRGDDRSHPALHLAAGLIFVASFWSGGVSERTWDSRCARW